MKRKCDWSQPPKYDLTLHRIAQEFSPYYRQLPDPIVFYYHIFDANWSNELMYFLDGLYSYVEEGLKCQHTSSGTKKQIGPVNQN